MSTVRHRETPEPEVRALGANSADKVRSCPSGAAQVRGYLTCAKFVNSAQLARSCKKSARRSVRVARTALSFNRNQPDRHYDRVELRSDCLSVFSLPEGAWI